MDFRDASVFPVELNVHFELDGDRSWRDLRGNQLFFGFRPNAGIENRSNLVKEVDHVGFFPHGVNRDEIEAEETLKFHQIALRNGSLNLLVSRPNFGGDGGLVPVECEGGNDEACSHI